MCEMSRADGSRGGDMSAMRGIVNCFAMPEVDIFPARVGVGGVMREKGWEDRL